MSGLALPAAAPPQAAQPVDWLAAALALEDPILDHARKTSGGDVIWLHPASFRGESPRPVGIGWGLYDGVAGVALFLAALDRVEGSDARREMVLDTLAPLRRHLRDFAVLPYVRSLEVRPAVLENAGLLGAAALALRLDPA